MLAALLATAVLGRVMLDAQPIESTALTRAPMPHFDPRSYGAKGDGVTYDTDAIQTAIDACAGTGGSVVFRPGKYVSAHLTLRGTMTVYLEKGASLLGGTNMNDYPVVLPEKPSTRALCRSLIYACNADGLTIDGEGEIDGRCKDVNMPDDVRKGSTESKRPSLIRIFRSRNITIRNITLRNPCMWTQIYSECDNLLIDGVTVDAPPDCWNLDGMDICDSRDVIVRNCNVRSEDDGICLKSIGARGLQNILLENNRIHCFRANAIKLGSSTRGPVSGVVIRGNKITYAKYAGLVLASVDGSVVKDIRVEDLEMDLLSRSVSRSGHDIDLQPREFRLLEYLMRHAGQVVTRTMLLENVWEYHFDPQTNLIDVHISRLRQKVDKDFDPPLIHTVRGAGYTLRAAR